MSLTSQQLTDYADAGYVVVPDVFSAADVARALADTEEWQQEFLASLTDEERKWYVDGNTKGRNQLRKLDNAVAQRDTFRQLASAPKLVNMVEALIGEGLICAFSQLFFKPPEGGGPKPAHQDNFYFGPDRPQHMVTAWLALDNATVENGCLHYWRGSHRGGLAPHHATADEPFNLQVAEHGIPAAYPKTAAPVPSGGVAFHHGYMFHQSANNLSTRPRRAVAIHYMQQDTTLTTPALPYDTEAFVTISEPAYAL